MDNTIANNNDQNEENSTDTFDILMDSKYAGAFIRGIDPNVIKNLPKNQFKYIKCLDREYDNINKIITEVIFDISRYGQFTHTIKFENKVTELEAIENVESFLSEKLTKEYYEKIRSDLFHELPWKKAKKTFENKGECLTDARFLERIYISENGVMTFFIGS